MEKSKLYTAILSALCVLTVLFIWSNSLFTKEQSQKQSQGLLAALEPAIEAVLGVDVDMQDDRWLRKSAHFFEFALLGLELALLAKRRGSFNAQGICNCLFAALLVAVSDESIQLLSNRGSQVQDVLLDFSGVITAVFLTYLIVSHRNRRKRRA